ncbi:hypothetical protein Sjap_012848 [Stephania japonica]|uniref:ABC transporter domain-containing protein n=1 Tax=Stephania japonica TaxID=461633 RepID=A0AAP0IWV8_9MAGN
MERGSTSRNSSISNRGNNGGDEGDHHERELSSGGNRVTSAESAGAFLVWEDVSVVLPNFGEGPTRRLLQGLTGYAEPRRIMAIMGPSGSGKSTLLDSLAGRLSKNVIMMGNVFLNGKKRKKDQRIAYVTQEDVLLGTLTVRETITYSAHLRLPSTLTKEEINDVVEGTIAEMGLIDCANTVIGNWHLRGVSGGEKKRVSIALEILTRPYLLFLDEPTSGLDSAAAFFVTQTLKNIARDGRTVVCSIHQPSSEVFSEFDDLFLLSGGRAVYFGEAKKTVQFFAEAGFPCPSRRNPSDHFLRCINTDFDIVNATLKGSQLIRGTQDSSSDPLMNLATAEIKSKLVEKYENSEYASSTRRRVQGILLSEGLAFQSFKGSQASWWKQFSMLTRRSFVNMFRDIGYYWLRIIIYILVALSVGTIFFDVGTGYTAIYARGSCGAFVTGFMTFMSIGGFPSFIEEMKVFTRERLNGYYGVAAFILSNFFSSFPFLTIVAFASGTITNLMVKFHPGFTHYLHFCLVILSSIGVVESCMMIVASLVPNYLMGIITGAGILGIMMMTAGFFRFLPDLPKPIWRIPISYISYGAWALQGFYKNDMVGLEFDPLVPGDPKLKGEDLIKNVFGISLNYSKWWDLGAVFLLMVCYRFIFFFVLKFKERVSPMFRTIYDNRTVKHLQKRPSFRRQPRIPSKRHTPIPLSSQLDLSSPIHY